jgi:hypothetical protein
MNRGRATLVLANISPVALLLLMVSLMSLMLMDA